MRSGFEAVAAAFARDRHVVLEPGWGAGNRVLKVDGKIFAIFKKDELVLRLPRERVDELVRSGSRNFDAGKGRPMKEWVVVGGTRETWVGLAREAHRFVGGAILAKKPS
jgi:hypothetical protein